MFPQCATFVQAILHCISTPLGGGLRNYRLCLTPAKKCCICLHSGRGNTADHPIAIHTNALFPQKRRKRLINVKKLHSSALSKGI